MNLLQTVLALESAAQAQPAVNTIVRNDVFRLNAMPDVKYGVFAWLQGEHTSDADDQFVTFNFTLFYVDRLTEDKGNELEVQSVGVDTLVNILRAVDGTSIWVQGYTLRTFNQRFADDCAGVFCNVALRVAKDEMCAEDYPAVY